MSQGEVWAPAREVGGNGSNGSAEHVIRMAHEFARATLEDARAEAERIRAAASEDAERIRASARAVARRSAEKFEGELRAMEAEIASLSKQVMELEARRAAPGTPAQAVRPAVDAAPALGELQRMLDARAQPRDAVRESANPPAPSQTSDLEAFHDAADVVDDPVPVPPAQTPQEVVPAAPLTEQAPQPRLSPIPLEAVLPMIALILLLIVVLAWLG